MPPLSQMPSTWYPLQLFIREPYNSILYWVYRVVIFIEILKAVAALIEVIKRTPVYGIHLFLGPLFLVMSPVRATAIIIMSFDPIKLTLIVLHLFTQALIFKFVLRMVAAYVLAEREERDRWLRAVRRDTEERKAMGNWDLGCLQVI